MEGGADEREREGREGSMLALTAIHRPPQVASLSENSKPLPA